MTREQAFWLLVAAALVAVFAKSFRAPSEHFWDAPPRIPITEQQAIEILARSAGIDMPDVPEEKDGSEPVAEEPTPAKEDQEPVPDPKPKPKAKSKPKQKVAPKAKPKPKPVPEPKEPRPVIDKETVDAMVSSVLPDLFGCYMYFMDRAHMNVDGQVLLAIEISARGAVTKVSFREDPLQIPRMEECVASKFVGKEIYPPPSEPVVARYPLTFTRPGAPRFDRYLKESGGSR
ncbi:hypothetical protein A2501_05200 [Candidatus Uhrbacteria bacterium RIFOXYC12_FULL_57_11]|nr:MAG: hypothetical protein A2501_05200 [Candidatus Uhrbacteria bacterium RIFOXYC12_FULL_57_11]